MSDQTLITLAQARSTLHVSHRTLRRLLQDGGVPIFQNPADRRVLLIRAADLEKVTELRPVSRPTEGGPPLPNAAA